MNQKSADLSLVLERTSSSGLYLLRKGNGLKGIGGLPLDPNKSVTCLISGGIDSPVASFMMQKRGLLFVSFYVFPFFLFFSGAKIILVHCQNSAAMDGAAVIDKVERLAEKLANFQARLRLFIVPFR